MNVDIQWLSFAQVFVAALLSASFIVLFYSIGLRLLVRSGHSPVVAPAEFTDAITIISEKDARRAEKAAAKSAKRSPLTDTQKRVALIAAYASFGLCGLAVLGGLLLILFNH